MLACSAIVLAGPAAAQGRGNSETAYALGDLELEALMELRIDSVYGASKRQERVTRAPSSITIITADEIKHFGHRTLSEVLRSVRGLYVPDDRNYSYLGIRGFHRPNDYNSRVLVLIDGHRINDNVFDSGTTGREGMVDVELIERVEIIRGPSSSIYGSSAFFGVINVITKRGSTLDGGELAFEAGSFDTYRSRATAGARHASGIEWLASVSTYLSEGPQALYYPEFDAARSDDPRAAGDGIARGLDGEDALNLFASARYTNALGSWTASALFSGRDKDIPTASFGTVFNDPRARTKDDRSYLDLSYSRELNEQLNLQTRAFYDRYDYSGDYPYDYAAPGDPPDLVVSKDGALGEWIGTEWQLTADFGRRRFLVGAEYRENLREYQYMYDDVEPPYYYLRDDRSSRTLGLFAQGEAQLSDSLSFTAGLRFDRYSASSTDVVNPRFALIYNPSVASAVKLLYGEAFRAPNPYESYYYDQQRLRPGLRPETIQTYEVVYEHYFATHYRLSVAAYEYQVDDLITQAATETDAIYFDNSDGARARGAELELEGKFDSGTLIRASYARQKAEDARTSQELTSSPRDLAKVNLSVPLYQELLRASFELQYQGAVRTLDGGHADDFTLLNVTLLSEKIWKGLSLSATIYNALDSEYGYPGAEDHLQSVIEQNGRTVYARATYGF